MTAFSVKSSFLGAGATDLIGGALVRRLQICGCTDILEPSSFELDQAAVHAYLPQQPTNDRFIVAAKVGRIEAYKTYCIDSPHQDPAIDACLIQGAHLAGAQLLMFLGSSCSCPRNHPRGLDGRAARRLGQEAGVRGIRVSG